MKTRFRSLAVAAVVAAPAPQAQADAITDWNQLVNQFVVDAQLGTPPAIRVIAISQPAALAAVTLALSHRAQPQASVDAGAGGRGLGARRQRGALAGPPRQHAAQRRADRGRALPGPLAAAAQAMDDAMISVFDAKYRYQLWRPVTAIRNGDLDGRDATPRDASWAPPIDNPMHPEYASGTPSWPPRWARC